MTEKKQSEKEAKKAEKETRKVISEDVEGFFRDVWGKVVEYASLGAEEASKVSASAKTRVDIETLRFKRGKMLKVLGEKYWELVDKDAGLTVAGTGETIRQIKAIDREIVQLEKELTEKARKPAAKKASTKKASTRKAAPPKAPAKKAAPKKKAPARKAAPKKETKPQAPPE